MTASRGLRVRQAVGTVPPSITYSVPVMAPARGEATNAMRSATSRGLAGRPRGMPPSDRMINCLPPSTSVPASSARGKAPPAARHGRCAFHLVSEARERSILRPPDVRVRPWRLDVTSHRSGGVERGDHPGTRCSRHGRGLRAGQRALAMSGWRGDPESRRSQAVAATGARLEKGQPVASARQACGRRGKLGEAEARASPTQAAFWVVRHRSYRSRRTVDRPTDSGGDSIESSQILMATESLHRTYCRAAHGGVRAEGVTQELPTVGSSPVHGETCSPFAPPPR